VHGIRSDATNSDVYDRSKVQVLELQTSSVAGVDAVAYPHVDISEHSALSDIQVVRDPSGLGCHGLVAKELEVWGS
jgi:hypothetical protein